MTCLPLKSDVIRLVACELCTIMIFGDRTEVVKDPVGFPPPVMLRLSELGFPIMPVKVRPVGINTF